MMDLLMNELKVNEPNPLYSLANITRQHVTEADTHPDLVHTRPAHQQQKK